MYALLGSLETILLNDCIQGVRQFLIEITYWE